MQTLATRAYKVTNYGVEFSRPLTADEFEALGHLVARVANATPWAVGDWLLAGEHMWNDGERSGWRWRHRPADAAAARVRPREREVGHTDFSCYAPHTKFRTPSRSASRDRWLERRSFLKGCQPNPSSPVGRTE